MSLIFIYITSPSKNHAEKIATHLLKKKLVAYANPFSIKSFYWWKGRIGESNEYVLIAKTLRKNFEKIKKEIKKVHEYKIPCITRIEVKANKEFEDWIKKEVR